MHLQPMHCGVSEEEWESKGGNGRQLSIGHFTVSSHTLQAGLIQNRLLDYSQISQVGSLRTRTTGSASSLQLSEAMSVKTMMIMALSSWTLQLQP